MTEYLVSPSDVERAYRFAEVGIDVQGKDEDVDDFVDRIECTSSDRLLRFIVDALLPEAITIERGIEKMGHAITSLARVRDYLLAVKADLDE